MKRQGMTGMNWIAGERQDKDTPSSIFGFLLAGRHHRPVAGAIQPPKNWGSPKPPESRKDPWMPQPERLGPGIQENLTQRP